jgi:hypothetical protein
MLPRIANYLRDTTLGLSLAASPTRSAGGAAKSHRSHHGIRSLALASYTEPSWYPAVAPTPTQSAGSGSGPVSCPSAEICYAVGNYTDAAGNDQADFEQLSGGIWSTTEVPVPSDAASNPQTFLDGLECAGVGLCIAVGAYVDSSSQYEALIESFSGGTWTPETAPVPSNAAAGSSPTSSASPILNGVSCYSSSSCVAYGTYIDTSGNTQGFFDTLSSGTWTTTEAPLVSGAASSSISTVSCPSTSFCVADGDNSYASSYTFAVIDTYASGTWTASTATLPSNASTRLVMRAAG